MLKKNSLRKCPTIEKNSCKENKCGALNSAYQVNKSCNFNSGWLKWCHVTEEKFKDSIFNNSVQINFTATTRTCVFLQQGPESWKVQDWHPNQKMMVVSVCLNGKWCSSECMGIVLYFINKDEGNESLPLLAFWRYFVYAVFLKYSKKGRSSLNQVEIRNISSDVCYNDTKHYEVQSGKTRQV